MSKCELFVWIPEYSKPPIAPLNHNPHHYQFSKSSTRYEETRESRSSDRFMNENRPNEPLKDSFMVSFNT